eukprot:1308042-Pleurochrysis_carterae.AAC.2
MLVKLDTSVCNSPFSRNELVALQKAEQLIHMKHSTDTSSVPGKLSEGTEKEKEKERQTWTAAKRRNAKLEAKGGATLEKEKKV